MDYSQLDLTGFAPKDIKIIKDNPGKTIYDLTMAGLSAKAAERLKEKEAAVKVVVQPAKVEVAQPVKVEQGQVKSVKPMLMGQPAVTGSTSLWVQNLKTGIRQYLAAPTAHRLARRHPMKYKIISH